MQVYAGGLGLRRREASDEKLLNTVAPFTNFRTCIRKWKRAAQV